jgi:citrate lyase subunit beta / citryl-CoA lyase
MTNTADDGPGGLGNPWLTGFGPGNGNGAVGRPMRSRRSTLAVPASSPRMIDKARTLSVDEVFLDLEDACAPDAKPQGRRTVIAALTEGGFDGKVRAVRVNDWTTPWTYRDVIDVVEGAGAALDCLILPKVTSPQQVVALDLLLGQLEASTGLPHGRIGIEAQIEDARGLLGVQAIAGSSARLEALVFGPADFMASTAMRSLAVGEQPPGYQPGDAFHHVLVSILVAARAHGLQAVDGPHTAIKDPEAFRRSATRSAALGYDGKWVLHPGQVDAANEVYSPRQEDYEHAENILAAYDWHTSVTGGSRGAAVFGGEMIDEATRKMALVVAGKGRAAGLARSAPWTPPPRPVSPPSRT